MLIGLSISLLSCAKRRQVIGPDIATPTTGNGEARSKFEAEKKRFENDSSSSKESQIVFESIVREHPDDPIVPNALLYSGLAAYQSKDYEKAVETLDKIEGSTDDVTLLNRASLFLGLSKAKLGEHSIGIEKIIQGRSAQDESDPEEMADIAFTLSNSSLISGQPEQALLHLDEFYKQSESIEDKAKAKSKADKIAEDMSPDDVQSAFDNLVTKEGLASAVLSLKLYREYLAAGDFEKAKELKEITKDANGSIGIAEEQLFFEDMPTGNPGRVGTLLPLSGKLNRIGTVLAKGISLATVVAAAPTIELDSVDSKSEFDMALSMDTLSNADVIAALGPFDYRAVRSAVEHANEKKIPLMTLTPMKVSSDVSQFIFHVRHSAEERAKALAKAAIDQGIKLFAVMSPQNRYGDTISQEFIAEVESLGGQVVAKAQYASDATSFGETIDSINDKKSETKWEAIFIPDLARKLELIVPALAVADLYSRPKGKRAPDGRPILVLSTAEGLSEKFTKRAGRYSWGALLAPGFYADRTDKTIAQFVTQYEKQNSRSPGAHEAYAFDAMMAIRNAIAGGAKSRMELTHALLVMDQRGVTGQLRFGQDGRRSDSGLIYRVTRERRDQYELTATREVPNI